MNIFIKLNVILLALLLSISHATAGVASFLKLIKLVLQDSWSRSLSIEHESNEDLDGDGNLDVAEDVVETET